MKKNIIKIILFILILLIILQIISKIFIPNSAGWELCSTIYQFHKEKKNTMDVMFVGDSSIYYAISPMEIYEKSKITSYDYVNNATNIWTIYYYVRDMFEYQKPKVLIIDDQGLKTKNTEQKKSWMDMSIDAERLSINKLDMLNDKNYRLSNYEKVEHIFPIVEYHNRWKEISEKDFEKIKNDKNLKDCYKGYEYETITNKTKKQRKRYNSNEKITFPTECVDCIKKIKELCDKNNCELIFIEIPDVAYLDESYSNATQEIANKSNFTFVNLNNYVSIDWNTDTRDGGNHLNYRGAKKISNYLTNYLLTNFQFEEKEADVYKSWNEELEKYNQRKQEDGIQ